VMSYGIDMFVLAYPLLPISLAIFIVLLISFSINLSSNEELAYPMVSSFTSCFVVLLTAAYFGF
jgi:hypothetical protein